ncbi:18117_t:CDS:1 [Gigaspora rosea]|nr:18117_t:CDS:1 [Gigaspora rosea]
MVYNYCANSMEPTDLTHNKIIRTLLSELNPTERSLIPQEIIHQIFPNIQNSLFFKYSSYTKTISSNYLNKGVKEWFGYSGLSHQFPSIPIVLTSLTLMFLRTNERFQLILNGEVYKHSSKFMNRLSDAHFQNNNLISLEIIDYYFQFKGRKLETFVNALNISFNLTSLTLICNSLFDIRGIAIANALNNNTTLITLTLIVNKFGTKTGEAFANMLRQNVTLNNLNILDNIPP